MADHQADVHVAVMRLRKEPSPIQGTKRVPPLAVIIELDRPLEKQRNAMKDVLLIAPRLNMSQNFAQTIQKRRETGIRRVAGGRPRPHHFLQPLYHQIGTGRVPPAICVRFFSLDGNWRRFDNDGILRVPSFTELEPWIGYEWQSQGSNILLSGRRD
jgi:hypothetical protein